MVRYASRLMTLLCVDWHHQYPLTCDELPQQRTGIESNNTRKKQKTHMEMIEGKA